MAEDFIRVGCKMPMGVTLNLDSYEVLDDRMGVVRRVAGKLKPVTLKGNAVAIGKPDLSINGYVFTPVSKAFWEEWLKTHADSSLLADGFIKPVASLDAGTRMACEAEFVPGQFERLVPMAKGGQRDPKDANRSAEERVSRGGSLGIKTFDQSDEGVAA